MTVSSPENIDSGEALGRAVIVLIGAIAELERALIVERVRAGMRRARIEGRHIGRPQLDLDRTAIVRHRAHGQSLGQLAKTFRVSRTTIARVLDEEKLHVTKGFSLTPSQLQQNRPPETAA